MRLPCEEAVMEFERRLTGELPKCREHNIPPSVILEEGIGIVIRCPRGCGVVISPSPERAYAEWTAFYAGGRKRFWLMASIIAFALLIAAVIIGRVP